MLCEAAKGPCNDAGHGSGLKVQTFADKEADPGWCHLIDDVIQANACPKGFKGETKKQHE